MISRIALSLSFFIAVFYLPWWVFVPLAIILIAWWGDYVTVILGGIIVDLAYGAPTAALHGFAYLYTALFILLALMAFTLRSRMIE